MSSSAYRSELDTWRANRVPTGGKIHSGDPRWPRALRIVCGSALLVLLLFTAGNGGRAYSSLEIVATADEAGIMTREIWTDAVDGMFDSPSPDGQCYSALCVFPPQILLILELD